MPPDPAEDRATPLQPSGHTQRVSREEAVAKFLAELGVAENEALELIRRSPLPGDLTQESIDQAIELWLRSSDSTLSLSRTATTAAETSSPAGDHGETIALSPHTTANQETVTHHADFAIEGGPATGRFGDYEILGEIARGGMGVVYKACQTKLNRIVALKMIKSAELADAEQVRRFYTEAEAAAKLTHPGIVPVYDVGEANGQHYFSMAFVDGESLSDRVKRDGPLMAREAARLMNEAAEAVDHAHQAEIVHRDIKPQNLLLNQQGKVQVADFGLAKLQQDGSELTAHGQVLGTPAYMPPEQAAGKMEQVGVLADVYSLGATLYFLLTGRPPFQAATVHDTLRHVLDNEPVLLRKLDPSIPRDLETICLKTLSKELSRRYESAGDLAADLQRWLGDEPIVARRVSRVERAWKWCKRKPVIAGLSAAMVLILAMGSVVLWERLNATHARGLVDSLLAAEPAQVPRLIGELENYGYWAGPLLKRTLDSAADNAQTTRPVLHARLALASDDASLADKLIDDLLASELADVGNIRDALGRSPAVDRDKLWRVFRGDPPGGKVPFTTERFRAGLALVTLDSKRHKWKPRDDQFLVEQLVASNAVYQPMVWELLDEIKSELLAPLDAVFVDPTRTESERIAAANGIARFVPEDGPRLARLLCVATPGQYAILHEKYRRIASDSTREPLLSVLAQQPTEGMAPDDSIALGKKRAGAAITLLRQGERESVLDVFRYVDNPEALSQFVARCKERSVTIEELLECFEIVDDRRGALEDDRQKVDDSVLYALLLALGEFTVDELPTPTEPMLERLALIYAQDPSSGVHSATGWLLRQWGQAELVAVVDQTPIPYDKSGHREWFVEEIEYSTGGLGGVIGGNRKLHFTFVVFPAGSFMMGSPENDPDREELEPLHQVTLTRPLAVCDREVSWASWMAMEGTGRRDTYARQFFKAPGENEPVFGVDWFDAGIFCRWLSERNGITEANQAYVDPSPLSRDGLGNPTDWPLQLDGAGFRLPTEAEWEYACRSGTSTAFSFGHDPELLGRYAWYLKNSEDDLHTLAQLRPSPRGLFDSHGNVFEWCYDRLAAEVETSTDPTGPEKSFTRVYRGGSFYSPAQLCRTAHRKGLDPSDLSRVRGFRLAVTLPNHGAKGQAANQVP